VRVIFFYTLTSYLIGYLWWRGIKKRDISIKVALAPPNADGRCRFVQPPPNNPNSSHAKHQNEKASNNNNTVRFCSVRQPSPVHRRLHFFLSLCTV